MPKKKVENKPFNTEKSIAEQGTVVGAPIVGGEFITEDDSWQGQTIEVQSDKHLEDDLGVGESTIIRSFVFAVNPEAFASHTPNSQDIFDGHKSGISALLWQDGLTPRQDVAPTITLSKDKTKYFITVAAIPQTGQTVLGTHQTLSQIANAGK